MSTRARKRATPRPPLKAVPPAEAGDFHSVHVAEFARELAEGEGSPYAVLHYFAEAVRLGYAPPDELLRWLAMRFEAYLAAGRGGLRLDQVLGLAPAPGKRTAEARTRHARRVLQDLYIARLALLDYAGLTPAEAVRALNKGVEGLLDAIPNAARPHADSSLATLAAKWRKGEAYKRQLAFLKETRRVIPRDAAAEFARRDMRVAAGDLALGRGKALAKKR